MKPYWIIFAALLILIVPVLSEVSCQQYKNTVCVSCPARSRLYNGLCYEDILGCLQYENGTICTKCQGNISVLVAGTCQLLNITSLSTQSSLLLRLRNDLYGQYGSSNFVRISLQQAKSNEYFNRCDNWMRNAYEQSYRISRNPDPYLSISSYINSNDRNQTKIYFKIIYDGRDGGLYLCIISTILNTTQLSYNNIRQIIFLESFVTVFRRNTNDIHCVDFDRNGYCVGCMQGYHLENGFCYKDIGLCVSFVKDICLECLGWSLLVQNRCIHECSQLTDSRNIQFYQNFLGTLSTGSVINRTTTTTTTSTTTANTTITVVPDPNCIQRSNTSNRCTRCANRYFLNSQQFCNQVNPLCRQWNSMNGLCTSCYFGYKLQSGLCNL